MAAQAPDPCCTLTAALCAVLDLADTLQHIVGHLTSQECQRLRETCKLLRHHPAVVEGVTMVKDETRHWQGLRQLCGLHSLSVHGPSSIFDLHRLSSLKRLFWVGIEQVPVLDLTPLSCIASMRNLVLGAVQTYIGIGSLQQLKVLLLNLTVATPDVLQLRSLTRLTLSEGSLAARLGDLSQLVALNIRQDADWTAAMNVALAAVLPAALPALRDLSCNRRYLRPLQTFTQLTALSIHCSGCQLSGTLQDLRPLTGLVKLGLDSWRGQPQLQSDSVTTLFLAAGSMDGMSFPGLLGCSRLSDIMLKLDPSNSVDRFDICGEQLPPRARTVWLARNLGSRLFLNMQAAEQLRVRRVQNLWWQSDPATLDADSP